MSRCADPEGMTMQEFKDLLWIDDTMETYIDDRKNRRAGVKINKYNKHTRRARAHTHTSHTHTHTQTHTQMTQFTCV
jgi:hypothetical protein